jgi:uncharacterized protein
MASAGAARRLVVVLLLATGAQGQPVDAHSQAIIDVHLHAHAADRFGTVGPRNPVTGEPSAARTDVDLLRSALEAMRRHNIVFAVASSALPSVERWRQAAPDRILGGAQIDIGIPFPDVQKLREEIRAGRIGMIGEIGAQFLGLSPADSSLAPYFALAEEMDIPVGVHTGIGPPNAALECCPKLRASLGSPLLLEELLVRHPKLRLSVMHAGYPYLEQTIALMQMYPQVYADLSAIDWMIPRAEFHRYLESLMRAGFGKRLMFGSDQMVWPESIGAAIRGIDSAEFLSPEQKRDIFYNNAARFFRIERKQPATRGRG